jgi:hypothetical protein
MNPLNPNLMTAKERRSELCAILARGIIRLRMRDAQDSAETGVNGLHFSPDRSGGANPLCRSSA